MKNKLLMAIAIMGIYFWIGNMVWARFNEPKIYYIPLSIFISLMLFYIKTEAVGIKVWYYVIEFLFLLSLGNIIKQVLYSPNIVIRNDYIFAAGLLIQLIWQCLIKQRFGKKFGSS